MRNFILLFFFAFGVAGALSQSFHERMQKEVDDGVISESEALYYEALRMADPGRLPERYRKIEMVPEKCGFGLIYRIRSNWNKFTELQRAVLRPLMERPDLPESFISESGRFKIHYTTSGVNSVPDDDEDLSGVPDYVEEAARAMDFSYSVEVEQLGYNPPLNDRNVDGKEWDVYLKDIGEGYYGWTSIDTRISTNPYTWTGYIIIDNDLTGLPTSSLDALRVTAAHEFFHMIQMGYNARDENGDGWFDEIFYMEASSVWMEDVVYDDINDYYYYLPIFFKYNNLVFNLSYGIRMYGLAIWNHFLQKRMGGPEIVRQIWEEIVDYPVLTAIDRALRYRGHTFDEELSIFYGWNYLTGSRADTINFYPEGNNYPQIYIDSHCTLTQDTSISDLIVATGSKYFQFYYDTDTITVIPTNLNWAFYQIPENMTLNLKVGNSDPYYTDMKDNVFVGLISDYVDRWRCVAIVESPSKNPDFISFNAVSKSTNQEDIVASYPSPFVIHEHIITTIPFMLKESGNVRIIISNISGYRVLEHVSYYQRGYQYFEWDGKDKDGRYVSSGIYIYAIESNNKIVRRDKIAVIR